MNFQMQSLQEGPARNQFFGDKCFLLGGDMKQLPPGETTAHIKRSQAQLSRKYFDFSLDFCYYITINFVHSVLIGNLENDGGSNPKLCLES